MWFEVNVNTKILEHFLKNLGDPDLARVLLTGVVVATVLESGSYGSGFAIDQVRYLCCRGVEMCDSSCL